MPTQIITTEDLREFKIELLNDLNELIKITASGLNKKYLKSNEIKKVLNLSPTTLQNLRDNGTLPYTKIGGVIFYNIDDVNKVMKENSIQNTL
jgi:hypothetical protein